MGKYKEMKPPKKRCEKCRYWSPLEPGNSLGECNRYPPVFINSYDDEVPEFDHPITRIYSTCGEFVKDDGMYKWR